MPPAKTWCVKWHHLTASFSARLLIVFTGKIRCCVFRICAFQYFILFHVITASNLLGREHKYTADQCLARETPFFIAALALSNLAAMY